MSDFYRRAALYHEAHRGVTEDIEFYHRRVSEIASRSGRDSLSILELACGTGRVAHELARAGHSVTGVDASEDMVGFARSMVSSPPRSASVANESVCFEHGDMRTRSLGRTFDLVLLPLNAAAHLSTIADIDSMCTVVASHLGKHGRFLLHLFTRGSGLAPSDGGVTCREGFDSHSLDCLIEWYEARSVYEVHGEGRDFRDPGGLSLYGRSGDSPATGTRERIDWYFVPAPRSPDMPLSEEACEPVHVELDLAIHDPELLVERAEACGLVLARCAGGFNGEAVSRDRDDWIGEFIRAQQ